MVRQNSDSRLALAHHPVDFFQCVYCTTRQAHVKWSQHAESGNALPAPVDQFPRLSDFGVNRSHQFAQSLPVPALEGVAAHPQSALNAGWPGGLAPWLPPLD